MPDPQINRVWRRLWRAFLVAGGEIKDRRAVERFERLVEDHVNVMPPGLSWVMAWVLGCEREIDYERLAADLAKKEGAPIGAAAVRQRVSRAARRLEDAIRSTSWTRAARPDRSAINVRRDPDEEHMPFEEVERHHRAETLTTLAGGRLIFTNLRLTDDFPALGIGREEHRLPIILVRDTLAHGSATAANLGLARAAAATANFPPVFPNAAIDVVTPQPSTSAEHRYWVTDGGALENRGLESMLYALESGL